MCQSWCFLLCPLDPVDSVQNQATPTRYICVTNHSQTFEGEVVIHVASSHDKIGWLGSEALPQFLMDNSESLLVCSASSVDVIFHVVGCTVC